MFAKHLEHKKGYESADAKMLTVCHVNQIKQ